MSFLLRLLAITTLFTYSVQAQSDGEKAAYAQAQQRIAEFRANGGSKLTLKELPPEISELAGLEKLVLSDTSVSDLSALIKLKDLRSLIAENTAIKDISMLPDFASFAKLWDLNLSGSPVSDISALSGMTELQTLYIGATLVNDISVLAELTG